MKVGILTFPNSASYGATLQMYALYKTVSEMGYDVEIINYYNSYMKAERHTRRGRSNSLKNRIKKFLRRVLHYKIQKKFRSFEKNNLIAFPDKPIVDKNDLKIVSDRYDVVICGSDQVWNPDITDSDLSYFFDFCSDKTKRISYAASFGKDELADEFSNALSVELEKFNKVSVREKSGKEIVEKLSDQKAVIVSDPTFLIDASKWRSLEKKHPSAKDKYILYYTVSSSEELWKQCLSFSQQLNMKVVVVGGNIIKRLKNKNPLIEYAIDIGPEEWLYLVDNASYVFTNSFHGAAFSLNFHKDFFIKYPNFYSSRLTQLISDTGMESRVLSDNKEPYKEVTCYEFANKKLNELKNSSIDFLKTTLSL